MKRPELLIPSGSLEVLKTAVRFGADAVYVGGEAFSLRARARNFPLPDMEEGIGFAHENGAKVYITANILAHNEDLEEAEIYFRELRKLRPDALIISDPGLFTLARELCPELELHISTQANNTNYRTCLFWYGQGARRIVTARELTLEEIRTIREKLPSDMEVECFVHGSMCISYSGRCLLSAYLAGRDANRGACTHPCRWNYAVMEETRPGEFLPVFENERGTFLFNSRDLCMIGHIPELLEAGVDSFKVEGRMKNALYVAAVTRAYRTALDDCLRDPQVYRGKRDWYLEEVKKCTSRPFTTGFYFGRPDESAQIYDNSTYESAYQYLGLVEEVDGRGFARFEQRNKFSKGDRIEIMKPDGTDLPGRVLQLYDQEGERVESAPHPKQQLWLEFAGEDSAAGPAAGDLLRRKIQQETGRNDRGEAEHERGC